MSSFRKMFPTWPSRVFGLRNRRSQMPWLECPSAISASTSRSRAVSWASGPAFLRWLTRRDTIVGSMTHSPSPIRCSASASEPISDTRSSEQIAGALRQLLDERHGVSGLQVVRQDEDPDLREAAPDLLSGEQPLVGVAGRHLDVGDHKLRPPDFDEPQESRGVLSGTGDLEAGLDE